MNLCEEQGFNFLLAIGQCSLGWATAQQGDVDVGLLMLSDAVANLQASGARIRPQVGKYLLTDALALAGRRSEALATVDEVLAFSTATGACFLDAELLRRKGDLLADTDAAKAESAFRQAIAVARSQAALLFELRASTSLARLLRGQDRSAEAQDLMRPFGAWLREAADCADVREARALLADLPLLSPI